MNKEIPVFFIDCSALKDMFSGKNKGRSGDLLKKLKEMKDAGMKVNAVTTSANFLRAIWLADPNAKIDHIQKTLSFLEVGFSTADFKDEKAVMDGTLKIMKMVAKTKPEN